MSRVGDSPDVVIARRLLDHARLQGFRFRRLACGPDGPVEGVRECGEWVDTIRLAGFSRECYAVRRRRCSLLVPGSAVVQREVSGGALTVLNTALTWPKDP